jgi:hypothetical protein
MRQLTDHSSQSSVQGLSLKHEVLVNGVAIINAYGMIYMNAHLPTPPSNVSIGCGIAYIGALWEGVGGGGLSQEQVSK